MDYRELQNRVERLSSMAATAINSGRGDWRAIWSDLKEVDQAFRHVHFPDRDLRQSLRDIVQNTASALKAQRARYEEERSKRNSRYEKLGETSANHLSKIQRLVDAAAPTDEGSYMLAETFATLGANLVVRGALNLVFGETDEAKLALQQRNELLREAGTYFRDSKDEMLGKDKAAAHHLITEARSSVNADWEKWKELQTRAYQARQEQRGERAEKQRHWEERQQQWKVGQQEFLDKLNAALDRKRDQLAHQQSHLANLYEKRGDAWSESYKDKVDDWICEAKDRIDSLDAAIDDIAEKISEVEEKLRGS
ncbi:hypothetical protein [Parerythrobacter lacustris]|uniref:Uncharacterized protein n=1 Tax=Parerythrobacter lacustris TaxID=2969984 RepID=A0ABT1XP90_9SPHN|nr:hypothetical protein [Parerythrobacter lacustris]MCR2833478.1 hypothetical protein [Parerythrobacter lacustris]